ncbi:MAG: exopolygalacturonase [Bacteroidaceae bacterium]|nr:exopolygalacturonase [Bacteroidaceae bacterium]
MSLILLTALTVSAKKKQKADLFPDGTPIPEWFRQIDSVKIENLGKQYKITDYGILNDGRIYTKEIQALIDKVASDGGGVIVVPQGTYLSGALFFKQGVHLHLLAGGTLMGSDDCSDFPLMKTRIEGESCIYYPALINADGLDGFTISGEGTIDGNGLRYWKHFWERRKWNPKCTNKDEQRPRLVFISNCKNVQIENVHLQNSPFWTTHIYKCENVKLLRLYIFSPEKPVKAPSTDAIDIDVCKNVLVKHCYMSVNDDAIALKGGKGPWADDPTKSEGNGGNENIIIEDCTYGFCHGCLTCGSESIYDHNIVLRRINVNDANNLLWLKMRPDTPQRYEYITVEEITGNVKNFLLIRPWTQFYDLKGRKDTPMSYSDNIVMRNIDLDCDVFFNVEPKTDQYILTNFTFENLNIRAKKPDFHQEYVDGFTVKNVKVEKK